MMIGIIDYGVGNLFSLKSSFAALGIETCVSGDPDEIRSWDKIILPGVGAFRDAAAQLNHRGLTEVIRGEALSGKPLLGICLGMQLLFEKSYEYGEYPGLGLIHGSVKPIAPVIPLGYKVPHIGWNALHFPKDKPVSPLFSQIKEGDYVYFVHSYYGADCDDSVIATTEYGAELTAAVAAGNVFGCQFHPEKSGEVGLRILNAFAEQ
jgi:glutamine amidotransferase